MTNQFQDFSLRLASALALTLLLTGTAAAAESKVPTVTVTTVENARMLARVPVSGTLVAREEVQIYPQINGYEIQRILVDIGDRVEKDELLLRLDEKTLKAQLAQAEADINRANASLRQSQSQIDAARASLTQAEASLQRSQRLQKSGSVSQAMLDDSIAAADSARASFTSANDGLIVAQAQLTQMQVQRDLARLNLSRASILSPVAGVISTRSARLGAIAGNANGPLFRITAVGEIELEAEVIETELFRVKTGDRVDVRVASADAVEGKVRLVSPTVDPLTRLGLVRIALPDSSTNRIGSFASGWIVTAERDTLVVPNSALQATAAGNIVTVVEQGDISKRPVNAGILYEGRREILSGLSEGETVLVRAGSFFRDGDRVQPLQVPANAASADVQ